jgi:hypothetical protein
LSQALWASDEDTFSTAALCGPLPMQLFAGVILRLPAAYSAQAESAMTVW